MAVKMCGIFSICVLTALLLPTAWADHHHHHRHGSEHSGHSDDVCPEILSSINDDFAFALYKNLRAKTPAGKNIFFSPLGISTVLSMVSAGAGGETHSQLFSTLGYSAFNQTQVNEAYKHLFDIHGHNEESLQLDVGNAAAVRSGFSPSETFLNDVKEFYSGEVFNVSHTNPSETVAEINEFIANKTQDKITDMVKDLDPDMAIVLINYGYFKGQWERPFVSHLTRKGEFHVDKTTIVEVDMMTRTDFSELIRDEVNHVTVVMLPYKGNVSMMIVLPDENKMERVERYINKKSFRHWLNLDRMGNGWLVMPKFSISTDAAMESTLREMGISNAFDNSADFSGISEDYSLKISKVSHRAMLSVTEKGTEAGVVSLMEAISHRQPEVLTINRPFLVFIFEKSTRSILFMGKINNPTAM